MKYSVTLVKENRHSDKKDKDYVCLVLKLGEKVEKLIFLNDAEWALLDTISMPK